MPNKGYRTIKNLQNIALHCNCVLIGEGLTSRHDFHLLVDSNGVKIDRTMTPEEKELITQIATALSPALRGSTNG